MLSDWHKPPPHLREWQSQDLNPATMALVAQAVLSPEKA